MEWFIYITKNPRGSYYVGITNDVSARIEKHNSGKGSQMARLQGPFELIYVSSAFPNKSEARRREVQIKKWTREKKEKLINGEWE